MIDQNLRNMILAEVEKQIKASDLPEMIVDPKSVDGQIKEVPARKPK